MTIRYLPENRIKELKSIIETELPEKDRKVLKKIHNETDGQISLSGRHNEVITNYYEWIWKQWIKDPQINNWILGLRQQSGFNENQITNRNWEYIDKNYKKEYEVIVKYDLRMIDTHLNNFTRQFNVDPLFIITLIECDDVDELLFQKYSKKNVDPVLMKRTEKIKTNIDNFFMGVDWNIFLLSLLEYQKTKDENQLHNNLNPRL